MDSRNISSSAPQTDNYLLSMFKYQAELLEKYKDIEGMPKLPMSIHTKEAQIWLKDMMWRVVEELGEALEHYQKNGFEPNDLFYEEITDAIHFQLEIPLLIMPLGMNPIEFTGITEMFGTSNVMELICNNEEGLLEHEVGDITKIEGWIGMICGSIGMMGNTLKNKKWKQSEVMADEEMFFTYYRKSTIQLLAFINQFGFNPGDIYNLYFKKYNVNKFRQDSNY